MKASQARRAVTSEKRELRSTSLHDNSAIIFILGIVNKVREPWVSSSGFVTVTLIMSDTDSEMGWIPSIVRRARMRKRASVARTRPDHDTDEESLYETMPQKLQKMNKKKRIVRKGGLTNVTYKNISKKRRRYISDLYTTLLDSSWSYVVLLFASSFYGSWIMFGGNNAHHV